LRETCIFLLTLGGLYVVSLPLFSSRIRRNQPS
jgi:hypothetical protein